MLIVKSPPFGGGGEEVVVGFITDVTKQKEKVKKLVSFSSCLPRNNSNRTTLGVFFLLDWLGGKSSMSWFVRDGRQIESGMDGEIKVKKGITC